MDQQQICSLNSPKVLPEYQGVLLIDKPAGITSFRVIQIVRRHYKVKTVGHAGTLDPFATGLLIVLVGRAYTRRSDEFMAGEKEYVATVEFGSSTSTYDPEGEVTATSDRVPDLQEVQQALDAFSGEFFQIPPMYSAKKIGGKKLYDIARKGGVVERKPVLVRANIELVSYAYPSLTMRVVCSKGTYIRSIAYDLAQKLGIEGHLTKLRRTRSGSFRIQQATEIETLEKTPADQRAEFLLHSV